MSTENEDNIIEAWNDEWIYTIVIDRFHDGKQRSTLPTSPRKGFGTAEELRKTCGGTLNGIRLKLDYIKGLGCTSILFTPFLENNPEFYHGYAIQDFLKVDARFGTLDDLRALVNEAHEKGLKVIIDVILNHTGNNWMYKERNTKFREKKTYTFSQWRYEDKPVPLELRNENWYSRKGYIVNWDTYPESWDGDVFELKDLAWTEDETGQQVLDCMVKIYSYWIEALGIDGFRLDALKHIRPVMANVFCERIKTEALRMGKDKFILIGEVVGGEDVIRQYKGVDVFFNFPFYFDLLSSIKENNCYEVFDRVDFSTTRSLTSAYYLDNHDQIGLEPKKRISNLLSDQQLLGSLFLMGMQWGIKCLYYGTEQGLKAEGIKDHDIRECMFDLKGEVDLLDESDSFYQKVSETIGCVKRIKKETVEIKRLNLNPSLGCLVCYDKEGKLMYTVVYNKTSEILSGDSDLLSHGTYVYSNYGIKESGDSLKPFELRVSKQ